MATQATSPGRLRFPEPVFQSSLERRARTRGRSSIGRALRSQCRGRGFDSLRLHSCQDAVLKKGCAEAGAALFSFSRAPVMASKMLLEIRSCRERRHTWLLRETLGCGRTESEHGTMDDLSGVTCFRSRSKLTVSKPPMSKSTMSKSTMFKPTRLCRLLAANCENRRNDAWRGNRLGERNRWLYWRIEQKKTHPWR